MFLLPVCVLLLTLLAFLPHPYGKKEKERSKLKPFILFHIVQARRTWGEMVQLPQILAGIEAKPVLLRNLIILPLFFRVSDGPVVLHDLLDKAESNFVLLWPFFCNASKIIGSAFSLLVSTWTLNSLDYKDFAIDLLGKLFG